MSQNNSQKVGIVKPWSLIDFAKEHGKMKITNDLVNSHTGEVFKSCAFIAPDGAITLVGFSSNLDTINPADTAKNISQSISKQKDTLQVVLLESGKYKLCKAGSNSWEDVDLGL